ncbi:hypothetical protein DBV05_g9309 [Lasiodiplodia theobromae]|uniref:FAD dependent oxidoreductase domain-containing protein n=1 Tax=Lasiodiplodia theobromae TaxID=45133 RepID=A0A5N5D2W1_9PEZI|nr:hypothetical protein DBV05_g9309 [Lasiodiplodia theobromae]
MNQELALWRDLSPLPAPLRAPTASSPRILVVGGGVTGLVTAWVLLDKGYHVTVLAKEWASYGKGQRLTSQIAGALWEFPPAVCGQHTDAISLAHSKRWCMTAYHIWDALAAAPGLSASDTGVRMKPAAFFFPAPVEHDADQLAKMREIMASGVRGFRRHSSSDDVMAEHRVDAAGYGVADAYELLAPIIDTDACMAFLRSLVAAKGARLVTAALHGDLFAQEQRLLSQHSAHALVNATGLEGARELAADDSAYPIRGALIRVRNTGAAFPQVRAALTITADAVHDASEIVFLVPRNDDVLLIGGIAEPGKDTLDLSLNSPIVRRMRERCERFLPDLRLAELDDYPLAQGLRPFRARNVRVERELRVHQGGRPSRIVHSYGQGGAGWSLSFGCAADVATLVDEALADLPARPMGEDEDLTGARLRGEEPGAPISARL